MFYLLFLGALRALLGFALVLLVSPLGIFGMIYFYRMLMR